MEASCAKRLDAAEALLCMDRPADNADFGTLTSRYDPAVTNRSGGVPVRSARSSSEPE